MFIFKLLIHWLLESLFCQVNGVKWISYVREMSITIEKVMIEYTSLPDSLQAVLLSENLGLA